MKNIFYILLLLPTIIFAQYPSNSGQKITLGEQTTADGLVYRGLASDTTRKPSVDTMAYILLDTNTNIIWQYKKAINNAWRRLNLLPSDTTSFNYVNTYGAQTVNGAKTLTSNLILKNSQEPSRATIVTLQTFAADTTNWTRGTGWTFNGTQAVATTATGNLTYTPALTITSGNAYEIRYTLTNYSAGTLTIAFGNGSYLLPTHNVTANFILILPISATGGFRFTTSSFTGNIDDVSVVEITNRAPVLFAGQDDNAATLYNSLRMPNGFTLAFGGGAANTISSGVFLGAGTGLNNTTGTNNIFVGSQTGEKNTTGSNNVFLGTNSGRENSIGNQNVFMGNAAGRNNTTGTNNIFIGNNSGFTNTTGSSNYFAGSTAGQFNTTGSDNVFIGPNAGQNNTTGFRNVILGTNAGLGNTTGSSNFFFGQSAGFSNTTGNSNIAIGDFTFNQNSTTTGGSNLFFGGYAGDNISGSASGNVIIGNAADLPDPLGSNQVVIKNIIFATGASGSGTIIAGSVGIGTNAPTARLQVKGSGTQTGETFKLENSGGTNLLTVLDNGFVGIGTPTPTTQMQLVGSTSSIIRVSSGAGSVSRFDFGTQSSPDIGRLTFSNADSSIRIRPGLEASELSLLKNGNLGISVATPTQKLHVVGNGLFTGSITTNSLTTNGIVYSNAGTLTNTNPSDSTLKNSINSYTYGLSEILQLKPKTFYYNLDVTRSHLKYGFIAQEVQPIMPDLVRIIGNGSDKLGLESEGIYVAMVNAIKELSAEIDILKQEIINLKNK